MGKKKLLFNGGSFIKNNLFIRGVSNTVYTPALLAEKLTLEEDDIQNFKITNNDISCKIDADYNLLGNSFKNNQEVTFFTDNENLYRVHSYALAGCQNLLRFYSSSVSFIISNSFHSSMGVVVMYIPNVIDTGDRGSFGNFNSDCYFYVSENSMTSYEGNPQEAIQYVIDRGNVVRVVQDYTLPNNIENIKIDEDYGTFIEMSWEQISGSFNTVDYYEVWVDGMYKGRTFTTSYLVNGLEIDTDYNIEIVVCDIYYNSVSSRINYKTGVIQGIDPITDLSIKGIYQDAVGFNGTIGNSVYALESITFYANGVLKNLIPIGDMEMVCKYLDFGNTYNLQVKLVDINGSESVFSNTQTATVNGLPKYGSYFKVITRLDFNDNVNDVVGSNNATPINLTYVDALNGRAGLFNTSIADFDSQNIVRGRDNVSVNILFKANALSGVKGIFSSWGGSASNNCILIRHNSSNIQVYTYANNGQIGGTFGSLSIGQYYSVIFTYNGSSISLYINGVKSATTYSQTGILPLSPTSERVGNDRTNYFSGEIADFRVYDREITQEDATAIAYNQLNGINPVP